ncbi:hypothetical protein HQ520_08880, partial [bacterium]|nr:hypothetical protein [bacterium]
MRELTALAQTESIRRGQDVAWILTVYWPDGPVSYSHRPISLPDGEPVPILIELGNLEVRGADASLSAALPSQFLRISLAMDGPETPSIRQRLVQTDPEGLEVSWGVIFLDAAQSACLSDRVCLFRGIVEETAIVRLGLKISCLDLVSARGRRLFGRRLSRHEAPEPETAAEGQMLPWVFGEIGKAELVEWRTGRELV